MDCRHCTDHLTAYADGELSPAESAQIRAHLEICVSCAAELSGFRAAAAFVESHHRELELKPESWDAVYARIAHERPASRFRFFVPKRIDVLATVAIVAVLAFGYLWYQRDQRRGLDDYISRYLKSREAGFSIESVDFFLLNPFTEAKPASDTNPFRLEDQ
ncbi:MAG TPA: zf-HC2 domain-containing protein [Acidobacteriota bacterium]|nr:zf-HC2 domain-containing protein [Acidobacteriota bacterium]